MFFLVLSVSAKNATIQTSWEPKPNWVFTRYREYPKFDTCHQCLKWIDDQLKGRDRSFDWDHLVNGEFTSSYMNKFQDLDQTPFLQNPANRLDESEILAIWFYTTDDFWRLRADIMSGTAGLWNCYFDFYYRAIDKFAPTRLPVLWSGISRRNSVPWGLTSSDGTVLIHEEDIVVATSPGSSSASFEVAASFMAIRSGTPIHGLIFEIGNPRTAVDISSFSKYPFEREFLFSPGVRLQVEMLEETDWSSLGLGPSAWPVTIVTMSELDPTSFVWKEGAEPGLTPTQSPEGDQGGAWATIAQSKAYFGVMIGALVLFIIAFVWVWISTDHCKQPCGGHDDPAA
jgi:hypothetical protein